ncbi:MAG: hypothetical protein L0I62_00285 [Gammaproteobacteria bacterium]|nr:hypothetical protein [Gammaproteobacteria bacterium]
MNTHETSALSLALEIQRRVADVGFDWPDADGPLAKMDEELAELKEAVGSRRSNPDKASDELGDLLFAVVNYARHIGVEPDAALVATVGKFQRRFRHIEESLAKQRLRPEDVGLEGLEALWVEAKQHEKK